MTKITPQDIDVDNDVEDEMYTPPTKTHKGKKNNSKDTSDKLRTKSKISRRKQRLNKPTWETK